ncbi:MAG: putative peptidoglycan-binding domain-containing protein [Thermodesulfobacteriota bacterium]
MPIDGVFEKALKVLFKYEISPTRFWDNHPNDSGGFTYYGIARNFHPDWQGWPIVDADMTRFGRPRSLEDAPELYTMVQGFYYREFWLRNNIHLLAEISPACAIEVFEASANGGGVSILQKTLNTMNKNGVLWPELKVDGSIGPLTILALRKAVQLRGEGKVYKRLNLYQGKRFFELQEARPEKYEVFDGWFDRVTCNLPEV